MTSTMLEAYDTQMLDYPSDIDVPMHASSSDLWFHNEATMEDDGLLLPSQKSPLADRESSTGVEVDMEPYDDDQNSEYEMADGVENYELEIGESVDVEVFDVSQAHTPPAILDIDTTHIPSIGLADSTFSSPSFAEPPAPDIYQNLQLHPKDLIGSSTALFTPSLEAPPAISPVPQFHEVLPDGSADDSEAHAPDKVIEGPSRNHDAVHIEESVGIPTQPSVAEEPEVVNADSAQDLESYLPEPEAENVHSIHRKEHDEFPDVAPAADHAEFAQHGASDESHEDDHEYDTVATPTADPHEISEGVYIDPPPAVLVSFLSSNRPGICLFNLPPSSSGSTSPSPENSRPEPQALTLLLHHRPTLYYEPLTSVFEALRQEESLASVPDFADGELVLDAYDLQLVISEDSIYTREITLHDLNVLHDGSDIYGPLRLQLRSVVPRFIVRYHLLQDQITRLNLAVEAREDFDAVPSEEQGVNDDIEHHDQELYLEYPEESVEAGIRGRDSEHPTGVKHQAGAPDEQHYNGAAPDDSSKLAVEHPEYQELQEDTNPVSEYELEYIADPRITDENQTEDAGEELDTDTVHQPADTDASAPVDEEYTEYEEYTEPHDGDGEYSENFQGDGTEPTVGNVESHVLHDSPRSLSLQESGLESATPRQTESVVASEDDAGKDIGNEHDNNSNHEGSEEITTSDVQEDAPNEPENVSKYTNHESHTGVDQSDSNFIAMLEYEADHPLDPSGSEQQSNQDVATAESKYYEEEDWDDNLDGDGDPDTTWEADHDTASNESSVTLSSKTSSKRGFDDVEPEEDDDGASPIDSPGSKRPRVQ